jgi:hypothetical protein
LIDRVMPKIPPLQTGAVIPAIYILLLLLQLLLL